MAYVDTSVLVAYYCPEALSEAAEAAVREADPPTISPLTEAEFASALSLKVRTRGLDVPNAERLLSLFRVHVEERRYRIVPVGAADYAVACDWLRRFDTPLRTLDALHLAVAFTRDLPLLTADNTLADAADRFGVPCTLLA